MCGVSGRVWREGDFGEFVDTLNGHHPSICVKVEKNKDRINFLDTTIFKGPGFQDSGRLDSKVYFKSTAMHAGFVLGKGLGSRWSEHCLGP